MKSAVETLNPTRVKLTVEVPFEELKPSLDAAYRTIAGQVNVPGFRKGKVPPRIIDQRFGRGAVLEEAVNEALPRLYSQAVQESAVHPLGQPSVDVTDVPDPTVGGDLRFTAEVDVRPEITLPDLASLAVSIDDAEVEDEDVEARVENLRARFGTLIPVSRPAEDGDFVSLDLRAEIDGEEIDSASGVSYQVGSGTMLDGLDDALLGLSAGETANFGAPLAGGDRAGDPSSVTVTVGSVKERQLPELDDDFAQLASEFDTLEELRADLRTQAVQDRRLKQAMQARERLLDRLLETVDIPVPEGVVTHEVDHHLESEGRAEDDGHRTEVEEQTRRGLRTQFLLDAIAEAEQVSVAEQDLVNYLVASAQQYGMDPNEFASAVDKAGQISSMVAEVARRKALDAAIARAVVTDASGNRVDVSLASPQTEEGAGEVAAPSAAPTVPATVVPTAADPAAVPVLDVDGVEPSDEPVAGSGA